MMKEKIIALLLVAVSLTSCNDYLDVVPKNDVTTIESVFEQRSDAYNWLKSCYYFLTSPVTGFNMSPGYLGADEFVGGQFAHDLVFNSGNPRFPFLNVGDGLQKTSEPYGNIWSGISFYCAIRYCNIFIDNIDNCYNMPTSENRMWKAEIKALKAHFYFELMRRYGPIILGPKNLEANSSVKDMQQPRQPIDSCVNAIVALCDEAMPYLPYRQEKEAYRYCYYNKEAAATLKAYALLYGASPLFNGNVTLKDFKNKQGERLFPDYDKEKWKRAAIAADSAIAICHKAGKSLYHSATNLGSSLLNTINTIEQSSIDKNFANQEVIFSLVEQGGNPDQQYVEPFHSKSTDENYDPLSQGCLAPSMKMVEMFYTDHGLPIEEDKQWMPSKYDQSIEADEKYKNVVMLNTHVLNLHRHREPRFYADVAADRTVWYRKVQASTGTQWKGINIQCRKGESYGTDVAAVNPTVPQSLTGYWLKKGFIPEAPLYQYTNNRGAYNIRAVVFRLAELYLMSAEAWNEYLDKPNSHVYDMIDSVRVRAGIPKVQEAWSSYAKDPDKVRTREGMRSIIHQEWNVEFAFEGRRFWNLRRWMEAQDELNQPQYGWNIISDKEQGFYNNGLGPIVVWSKRSFKSPRDYFFPIKAEEVLISGARQNPGWGGDQ